MARPIKEGLDYFPLDVDIDQDDKIALIEASHGLEGFGIVIKLLMKIYDNSYFYKWGEKEQLLFSRRVNVNINKVNEVINDCIKWELFSSILFEQYKVLTSKGIQKRYLEAAARRKEVKFYSEYMLLNGSEVKEYKNLVTVNINSVNDNISTQSKGKESKENIYMDFPIHGDPFLEIYNHQFAEKFNKQHMRISQEKALFIHEQLSEMKSKVDVEEFEDITQYHFANLPKSNDGNFLAFIHAFPRYLSVIKQDEFDWDN